MVAILLIIFLLLLYLTHFNWSPAISCLPGPNIATMHGPLILVLALHVVSPSARAILGGPCVVAMFGPGGQPMGGGGAR